MQKYKTILFSFFVLLLGLFVGVSSVNAHSLGQSIERMVDGYLVDIGYNAQSFQAGEPVRLDFRLSQNGEPVEFTDVWVRINQGPKTILAGNLGKPPLGRTGITTIIPETGEYTLNARYMNGDETLVEFSDSLTVEQGRSGSAGGNSLFQLILMGIVGILAGFLTSYYLNKD